MSVSYILSRISLALIFFYHGLVPKLLFASSQEIEMNEKLLPFMSERAALLSSGYGEVIYALCLVIFIRSKLLLIPAIAFASLATIALLVALPHMFTHAFNPFSINLAVISLAAINLIESRKMQ